MAQDDTEQDLPRNGTMTLRARLVSAEHKLAQERDARERAEADAKALAEFIADRSVTAAWSHGDVLNMMSLLERCLLEKLTQTTHRLAATGAIASHVIYAREIQRAREEAVAEVAKYLSTGLDRPDMATADMRAQVAQVLKADGT